MTTNPPPITRKVDYPTSDGKPMAETDYHRDLMFDLIGELQYWYADTPRVYVSGNLLLYYVPGDKRKHLSPDVFVVFGVAKKKRLYYLTWEEGKNPNCIIEITSKSTRREDTHKKLVLYRDTLKVKEYFLFDPFSDYLKPQLQGYRLQKGDYVPIELVDGRMPSKVLGLHLEVSGTQLRLYDPETQLWIPTADERAQQADVRAQQSDERAQQADERAREADKWAQEAVHQSKALAEENEQLRQQLARLKHGPKNGV